MPSDFISNESKVFGDDFLSDFRTVLDSCSDSFFNFKLFELSFSLADASSENERATIKSKKTCVFISNESERYSRIPARFSRMMARIRIYRNQLVRAASRFDLTEID